MTITMALDEYTDRELTLTGNAFPLETTFDEPSGLLRYLPDIYSETQADSNTNFLSGFLRVF